jgi:hypothetical protein
MKEREFDMTNKQINDKLREEYVNQLIGMLTAAGEEVLRVGSNVIAIPVVDAAGEDNFVEFTVKVPTGSRDGDPYDGYSLAEDFKIRSEAKAEKAAKAAEEKAKKIARDEAMRRQKAEAKAKREG